MIRTAALVLALGAAPALAQYTGPSASGESSTVASAQEAGIGSYVTLTGNIVSHLREEYYMFADDTGEMRVEIQPGVWNGRAVGPDSTVTITGEVDRRFGVGPHYMWVKSLTVD